MIKMICCKCKGEVIDGIIAIRKGNMKEPICIDCWEKVLVEKMNEERRNAVMLWLYDM